MTDLFAPAAFGSLKLANRFIRSATWEGMATEDGAVTDPLIETQVRLAEGGVGMILPGHAYVSKEGQAGPWQMGVHEDAMLPGLTRMAESMQGHDSVLVLQLAHAGSMAIQELTGTIPLGPSEIVQEGKAVCRETTEQDIERLIAAFATAAERAKRAGFDGVQIHGAHGYLLSQFLSPFFNRRTDAYGGDQTGRAKMVLEVLRAIRSTVGTDFPILIKINSEDFLEGGLTQEQMLETASLLDEEGIDGFEISGGTGISGRKIPVRPGKIKSREEEGYYRETGRLLKERVKSPVSLVGGIRSLETAQETVDKGEADFISLGRPLIREPYLIKRWQSGDTRPAQCISDNGCFKPIKNGEGVYCFVEMKETGRKFIPGP